MSNRTERAADSYSVLEAFRHEIRCFLNFSERAARAAGIEPQQHQALLVIKAVPSGRKASVGFLAERLQVQHHSAVELSDRLEKRGLVQRSRSGPDRRQVFLTLTERAENLLRRLSESHRTELRTTGPRLLEVLEAVIRRADTASG